jgi:trimeric autotransporter adhesin
MSELGTGALQSVSEAENNTALGSYALKNIAGGSFNIGIGGSALFENTGGTGNTAVGVNALQYALGSYNTALEGNADPAFSNGNITNSTAVGNLAQVTQSNSMVLGSINGVNSATADTNVGIGITAPAFKLHIGNGGNGIRVEGPQSPGTGLPAATFGGFGDFGIAAACVVQPCCICRNELLVV